VVVGTDPSFEGPAFPVHWWNSAGRCFQEFFWLSPSCRDALSCIMLFTGGESRFFLKHRHGGRFEMDVSWICFHRFHAAFGNWKRNYMQLHIPLMCGDPKGLKPYNLLAFFFIFGFCFYTTCFCWLCCKVGPPTHLQQPAKGFIAFEIYGKSLGISLLLQFEGGGSYKISRWWFQHFFLMFTPNLGEEDSHFDW